MAEPYIKAKYEVKLINGSNCILFQSGNDRFIFVVLSYYPDCKDWTEEQLEMYRSFSLWNRNTVSYEGWSEEARIFIQRALSGDLKPFWTCDNKIENKTENNKCTCPYENFTWAGGFVGCKCRKEKNNVS